MRKVIAGLVAAAALLFAPLLWLWVTIPVVSVETAKPVDAVLIFGALVRDGAVSPLHGERLDTGLALWQAGKAQVLVASNATRASVIMGAYLQQAGVPETAIELDGSAQSTPDTCVAEAAREAVREVALVSQAYHLPRIALQCRRLGVTGQYVAAQRRGEAAALMTRLRVRAHRYTREAVLIWAELLGQYRVLERTVSP